MLPCGCLALCPGRREGGDTPIPLLLFEELPAEAEEAGLVVAGELLDEVEELLGIAEELLDVAEELLDIAEELLFVAEELVD